ncbi:AAA family ATPase [Pseudolactococcus reticulitermitis]|uniref:Uncharacterized protein n=1 Tax=Pseudolactococcus reticulitermitis TaxID=2025039 RepID=A0A224WZX6_9LACT|nr:AAA family ATPase [Lactococcus reticulitermitis]GAX47577.1 hypothetical protein RsY01_1177 [Lactococcus reticulitermitis]
MTVNFDKTLEDISLFMQEQGFFYSDEQIYDFYTSLITKPFVILSGISGSGKSKIADLFAEYMGIAYENEDNYELIAVKPNWTDNRGIFGYHNLLNDTYQITPTLKLFLRAKANPEKPYFLVLDEMNLAKVEYYFSDFLSLIESRRETKSQSFSSDFVSVKSTLGGNITLSQAIILSAIQMGDNKFRSVEDYRETPIAKWWLDTISTGSNPTAQFRSELNQDRKGTLPNGLKADGSRLAGKAFWAEPQGNSYKLKSFSEMDDPTRAQFSKIRNAFVTETNSIKQGKIDLHNFEHPLKTVETQDDYIDSLINDEGYYVPSAIEIPLNVFVIGTVNVDETTYMFSPKVLDRSNVIELNDIDLFAAFDYGTKPSISHTLPPKSNAPFSFDISLATTKDTKELTRLYPTEFKILISAFDILKDKNKHFGYRVFNEISSFVLNYCGSSSASTDVISAIDLQILQKVLPKISGSDDEISTIIVALLDLSTEKNLVRSAAKLAKMQNSLNLVGYATFIE